MKFLSKFLLGGKGLEGRRG